ncbi:tripartite tricarboxylate transporter substrate binding protein [Allopusillimonas soli]|uniref:Tripartite tricarboxylate transporter substrate binding protein n=1 Tax=Allopusillimonas soli TaxID=659016 RepID=A0A853F9J1_9BURK|nr:tripartite tricarboxylate transporter substrate binding protein [Allopusillimonas soli]NYT36272.1 tripartite tricarboxylate transporter substrate binding protein [Allopusillimonas soli]TEA76596.1 tripartite tricarboxylate transporter substrate binding protein [Allopusillimonas soli]
MNQVKLGLWPTSISLFFSTILSPIPALAQTDLCAKPAIELVVPWAAGGGTDTQARMIAQPLGERLGKQIVVINKAGAGGVVGTSSFVNAAKPDGCTLIMATGATNATAPFLFKELQFKPLDDFTPIAFVAQAPNILFVRSDSPYHSVQDVIDAAKAKPGALSYASGGVGASSHLAAALFAESAGLDMVHVPYQGAAPAIAALMGGQVDLSVDTGNQLGHVRSGRLRALAVASKERLSALPDVPTFAEAGVKGVYYAFWGGVAGPKGLPDTMVRRLNKEINAVMESPKVASYFLKNGSELKPEMTPMEFKTFWQEELKKNEHIVAISGAKAQ